MQHLPPDTELALSCQRGHPDAFDTLYMRHLKGIYAFVYYRVTDRMTAEDLTSQTFLKALERIGSFDHRKGAFSTWLYRIARNTVTDHFRTRHPHEDIDAVWDLPGADDPTLDAQTQIAREQVRVHLQQLPHDKRDLIILRLWDGLSYKEIAEVTGKSEASLKMMFSRTIADLRASMPPSSFALLLAFPALLS
jgi:RNA polymerase sigma-70 factor, ECF subfamily